MSDLDAYDEGFLLGILVGEGHFGGNGSQAQVTLRMHVRHEKFFHWIWIKRPVRNCTAPITTTDGTTSSGWRGEKRCARNCCRSSCGVSSSWTTLFNNGSWTWLKNTGSPNWRPICRLLPPPDPARKKERGPFGGSPSRPLPLYDSRFRPPWPPGRSPPPGPASRC